MRLSSPLHWNEALQGHHQLSGKSDENKAFWPNQSAHFIYIKIELCYFSLDQWEIRIHLLWGKCFNSPHHCDPHLNQTKFNDLLPLTIHGVLAWHFIAFLTQPAVPDRHCQGTTIFALFAKPYYLPSLIQIFIPRLQLRIDIVKKPREIFALQIFPELAAILHRATITPPFARPLGRFLSSSFCSSSLTPGTKNLKLDHPNSSG